jgi:hypothetical protein
MNIQGFGEGYILREDVHSKKVIWCYFMGYKYQRQKESLNGVWSELTKSHAARPPQAEQLFSWPPGVGTVTGTPAPLWPSWSLSFFTTIYPRCWTALCDVIDRGRLEEASEVDTVLAVLAEFRRETLLEGWGGEAGCEEDADEVHEVVAGGDWRW